ncbi:MAG TPA: glutamate-cysteine ligase family protein, partial [Devosia sp.]|nr:glutamate-cysteine ligase family protein [Devosia sp.]
MAGAESSPLITSRADMVEVLARGSKPKSEWRVGTEHEKHVYRKTPVRPVPYEGSDGIHALLDGIGARTGWQPFFDAGNPIGLRNAGPVGGISLEPGGQFELSGAPQASIHDAARELDAHLADCHAVGAALNIHFLGLGVTPLWSVAELRRMPKSRYAIMTPYMEKVGTLGTSMMYRSATVQANLDFSSEADMVKKMRVALALQPVVTALFANSPFVDGKPSGDLSFRARIWLDTDRARTGLLPFVFDDGFGFDRYVE